jgi:hypothetical protein
LADIHQKHALWKQVFKDSLMITKSTDRIPSLNLAFSLNTLKLKEKGQLFVEQPESNLEGTLIRTRDGNIIEPFYGLFDVIESITNKPGT